MRVVCDFLRYNYRSSVRFTTRVVYDLPRCSYRSRVQFTKWVVCDLLRYEYRSTVRFTTRVVCDLLRYDYRSSVRCTTRVVCDLLHQDYRSSVRFTMWVVCNLLRHNYRCSVRFSAIYYASSVWFTTLRLRCWNCVWMCLFRCKGGWVGIKLQRELFRKWDHWRPQVRRVKVMTTAESESVRKSSEHVILSRGGTHCRKWGETVLPHVLKLQCCSMSRHFLYSSWSMSVIALYALVFSVSHCARILITS